MITLLLSRKIVINDNYWRKLIWVLDDRSWARNFLKYAINSDYLIPICLKPSDLRYFKLQIILDQISKVYTIRLQTYRNKKIWVWGKYSIPLWIQGKRITAIGVNPTRKLIAFSEYGERPLLIIFDLETRKRRKILRCSELKSFEV